MPEFSGATAYPSFQILWLIASWMYLGCSQVANVGSITGGSEPSLAMIVMNPPPFSEFGALAPYHPSARQAAATSPALPAGKGKINK
jgi:hypothetical protein